MDIQYKANTSIDMKALKYLIESAGWVFEKRYEDYYLDNSYYYLGCFQGQSLIGFIQVISNGYSDAYIQDLVVHPDFQKQGIAHALIKQTIAYLKAKKIRNVSLILAKELIDFYEGQGFNIQYAGRMKLDNPEYNE